VQQNGKINENTYLLTYFMVLEYSLKS